jgi:hypothetical protein
LRGHFFQTRQHLFDHPVFGHQDLGWFHAGNV